MGGGVFPPDFGPNGTRAFGFGQQDPSRELLPLPPDASSTLFVEGLPSNCSNEGSSSNGDPIVLCFVDFENPACAAATARNALQDRHSTTDLADYTMYLTQAIEWMKRNVIPRFCKSSFPETQVQDQGNVEEGGDELGYI
ncbi:hypothetical protein F2Q68_00040998 [Brassica cretica]|nr:hypothetical protein F2Q68_00040998 [Brassica cretica]